MKQILNFLMVIAITLSAFSVASAAPKIEKDMRQPNSIAQHADSHVITVTDFTVVDCYLEAIEQPSILIHDCNIYTPKVTTNVINHDFSVKLPDKRVSSKSYIIQENLLTCNCNKLNSIGLHYRRQGINSYISFNRNIRYNLSHDYGLSC